MGINFLRWRSLGMECQNFSTTIVKICIKYNKHCLYDRRGIFHSIMDHYS